MNGILDSASPRMAGATSFRTRARRPMLRTIGSTAVLTVLLAVNTRMVLAQEGPAKSTDVAFGVSAVQTRPVGALGTNIGSGYGLVGTILLPLDRSGVLSLRADIGASQYGSDTRRTAFSETVGGRVTVDVRTTNTVAPADLGLQLALPMGPVRPYLNAGASVLWFYTESSVEPTAGGYALATTTNQSDVAFGWTLGGGFYVPLKTGSAVMLDVGGQYVGGGTAEYLTPESIVDLPGGEIDIAPMESSTHLVALRVGVRFGW